MPNNFFFIILVKAPPKKLKNTLININFYKEKTNTINKLLVLVFISGLVLVPSSKIFLFSNSAILVSICIAAFNLLLSIYNIQFMTFIQMMTDRNHIGRVFGIIFSIAIIFMPLGTFFFQAILDLKSIYNYLLFGKLLIITASIAIIMNIFISND